MGHAHGLAHGEEIRAYADERVRLAGSRFWAGGEIDRVDVLDIARSCLPAHEAHSAALLEKKTAALGAQPQSSLEVCVPVPSAEPDATPLV